MRASIGTLAVGAVALGVFCVGTADAHFTNETSQGPAVAASAYRGDIMFLVVAGVVPSTRDFVPDEPLSRRALAAWAALTTGLGERAEAADAQRLAALALDRGLVDSLEGVASYGEINELLFEGRARVVSPGSTPTGGEAAAFVAAELMSESGSSLLRELGFELGPTGAVANVDTVRNADGSITYLVAIADTTVPMYAHARVANGPTDPARWVGRTVTRSLLLESGDRSLWAYLEGAPAAAGAAAAATGDDHR